MKYLASVNKGKGRKKVCVAQRKSTRVKNRAETGQETRNVFGARGREKRAKIGWGACDDADARGSRKTRGNRLGNARGYRCTREKKTKNKNKNKKQKTKTKTKKQKNKTKQNKTNKQTNKTKTKQKTKQKQKQNTTRKPTTITTTKRAEWYHGVVPRLEQVDVNGDAATRVSMCQLPVP